jgi:hypothetical protein
MTQRGNFRGKESQVIGSRDGKILKSSLGTDDHTSIASPEDYQEWGNENVDFNFHSNNKIKTEDRFSMLSDNLGNSDQLSRSVSVTAGRSQMKMYMLSRQGSFHYWTSTEPESYSWNLRHLINQDYNYISRTIFR